MTKAATATGRNSYELAEDEFLFTSESVNEGHPDKLCDIISDSILDACLKEDPDSFVACECAAKSGLLMVFGEISSKKGNNLNVDFESVARETIKAIGYDSEEKGISYADCCVNVQIEKQSVDINQCVKKENSEEIGAGDQGIMFGYASDETEECMPLSHLLATKLGKKLTDLRKNGTLKWLRPDGKTQVTVLYKKSANGQMIPLRVHTVLISTQHSKNVSNLEIQNDLLEYVIKAVIPSKYLNLSKELGKETIFHLNPSGRFIIGGPNGDAGLTGRKIIVDTYGGWGAHGGGAFSGKDPTKVDRSGAYAARWIAKTLVKNEICHRCAVQLSYAIGVSQPLSIHIETYDSVVDKERFSQINIRKIVRHNFDLTPAAIIRDLKLRRPIYKKTSCYGHFGRSEPEFLWEVPKKLNLDCLNEE